MIDFLTCYLQRCGLRKLIYLVEGDPNLLEAAESIKTAYGYYQTIFIDTFFFNLGW